MKRKTINHVIKKKLIEWRDSITDQHIKDKLLKHAMVSGGCIASMFLGQDVNDFDIYIKDMNFLNKLASYYAKQNGCTVLDGRKKADYLKEWQQGEYAFSHSGQGLMSKNYVRVKTLYPDQVKLDVPSEGVRFDVQEGKTYQPIFFSQNAISLSDKIQIVLRFSGTIEEIHKNYDFIHATNYYTPETGLVTNADALEALLAKELRYQGSLYPVTSIVRMKKFLLRGWKIGAGEMLKIMFQISELDLKNVEVLEQQLIGVDVAYFAKLIEVLQGVKKEDITSRYLNTLIDRVFNETEDGDSI